jgi:CHAT domain-containing protein
MTLWHDGRQSVTGAMRIAISPSLRIAAGLLVAALLSVVGYQVSLRTASAPEALLKQADDLSWLNSWIAADPLYRQAEAEFLRKGELSKALYARVSQVPAHSESSTTIPSQIRALRRDLDLPEAHEPETRLRILTILGMLETNYDASMARQTWFEIQSLAMQRHHYLLASRAAGEQGIAAFLLGDLATAKKDVEKAWVVAKVADPAAHIRYASMYGTGLVELHKYNEALGPLDEAIKVAAKTPDAAYPSIAATAKIEALSGIGENDQALALAAEVMRKVAAHHLTAHLYELHKARARVYEHTGNWQQATSDLTEAVEYAKQLSYWRGITQADGLLAAEYLHQGAMQPALTAINEAIESNKQIPDELYFVPKNLAIKAAILARLGKLKSSDDLYGKSTDLLDALLSKVPTPMVERSLLSDLGTVYAGYFESLSDQGRIGDAFREIERARGRVEAQGLSRHYLVIPHKPTSAELRLTNLNLELLDTDDPAKRAGILEDIYTAEQQVNGYAPESVPTPVALETLQKDLPQSELFIEYVLDDPTSYALAVTKTAVHRYELPPRAQIEQDASQYRSEIAQKKTDLPLAERLFQELFGRIPEYREKPNVVVVPDGKLHLLPFSALADGGKYVLTSHVVSVAPSGTVFDMLTHRASRASSNDLPYVGVAAWISKAPATNLLATITRAVSGPERAELVALPESRNEVETIAGDLPKPSTILLGGQATETAFKRLPLKQYRVIHLALHGYADPEFPDRSALVFAPEARPTDDGLLQVREIRRLPINASLVTLSACDTGVGPVGEEGVANIVNAFIEAGAQSVASTLWKLEDHATSQLMISFYGHLARGDNKAEALRKAQVELLNSGDPPYFWAGFELDGDPSATVLSNPTTDVSLRSSR